MYDYVRYVGRIAENKKKGLSTQEAVDDAVNWAIKGNLLDGFFKVNRAEVSAMCLTEYDEEAAKRAFREDGYLDGVEDGMQKKAVEVARSLYANGVSVELIAKSLQMTVEQVKNIVKDTIQKEA